MSIQRIDSGRGHSYKVDGKKYEGVTTLIKQGLPIPALPFWSARTVAEWVADADPDALETLRRLGRNGMVDALKGIPWTVRDQAAIRGTEVHKLAEKLVRGDAVDVPEHLTGHVDSMIKFFDEWRVAPVAVEAVVANRQWRYAGTADLIGDLPDSRRFIGDYKTSPSGVWPETALQLAAYRHAEVYLDADGHERPMAELNISAAYAIHIRADGYDVLPIETGEEVFRTFAHVAWVAQHIDAMKGWIGAVEQWEAATV